MPRGVDTSRDPRRQVGHPVTGGDPALVADAKVLVASAFDQLPPAYERGLGLPQTPARMTQAGAPPGVTYSTKHAMGGEAS